MILSGVPNFDGGVRKRAADAASALGTAKSRSPFPFIVPQSYLKYRSARADKTRNTRAAFVGDSTFAGVTAAPATTDVGNSVPMQLAKMLNKLGIPAGANNRFGVASSLWTALVAMDGRVSGTGAWSQTGSTVAGGNGFGVNTASAGSMSFTPQDPVTKFDIYWQDSGTVGKTLTYQVDGGSTSNIVTTGSSVIRKTTVNAGTLGSHTLTLAQSVNNFALLAIDAYDDTGGRREISFWNWGISGATSSQLISNAGTPFGRLDSYAYFAPDLSIVEGGIINDWRQSVPVATSKANLSILVQALKATGDVILYTPRYDGGTTGATSSQDAYVQAMREVGVEQGVDVWDARAAFGSYALGNGAGFYGDTVHGDSGGIGYGDEAAKLLRGFFLTV